MMESTRKWGFQEQQMRIPGAENEDSRSSKWGLQTPGRRQPRSGLEAAVELPWLLQILNIFGLFSLPIKARGNGTAGRASSRIQKAHREWLKGQLTHKPCVSWPAKRSRALSELYWLSFSQMICLGEKIRHSFFLLFNIFFFPKQIYPFFIMSALLSVSLCLCPLTAPSYNNQEHTFFWLKIHQAPEAGIAEALKAAWALLESSWAGLESRAGCGECWGGRAGALERHQSERVMSVCLS